ncbi:erythroblast NAD(P)(+)--arginine ADP-ribosyltransferase-like isoform X1 [Gopherus evgoodei]|uniref:erythroblast NAD(P)(+)--arginine ADP-ribosyltransferase-like isoform X1 n=2 Tax=Gopherus evgoodei TaxID=1825980 RepID=UPI0011CEFFC4|nr:erythroblast NAD(P)(+)--arginine ADP-ribosyltransferase-like isoform X1 [Gopherus evgoodei]
MSTRPQSEEQPLLHRSWGKQRRPNYSPPASGARRTQMWMAKMERLRLVLVLLLAGIFVESPQVQCFSLCKRDLFSVRESPLDMALSSFDDQYKDCVSMMEAELGELNLTELANNRNYAETWLEAASSWKEMKDKSYMPRNFKPEYAIAILAYTSQGPLYKQPLHQEFNAAVREAGRTRDFYLNNFNFKTLHFLLTRALHVLKASEPTKCHQVYRGVRGIRFKAESRKPVRFGHFTSTSLKNESALHFGQDTFFSIKTCHGVIIKNFSFFPGENEVLIPPFEIFKVTNFSRAQDRTFIQLLSLDSYSNYNCEYVKEKRCKTRRCVFSSGMSSFSFGIQCLYLLGGVLLASSALGTPDFL